MPPRRDRPDPERQPIPRPKLLSALQVAERCGVSLRSVRRWIAAGDLAVHRSGRAVRVSEADLRRFLERRREEAVDPEAEA